jgi:hypothetical protein
MSCENNSSLVARLACRIGAGIAQLSGRRAYYAGLAGAGLAGAGMIALARQRAGAGGGTPLIRNWRDVPELPARAKIEPVPQRSLEDERCAGCRAPAADKGGLWYRVNGRAYCQDCAPDQARKTGADLVLPGPAAFSPIFSIGEGAGKTLSPAAKSPVAKSPSAKSPGGEPLPGDKARPVVLVENPIRVTLKGEDPPVQVVAPGYVVLRKYGKEDRGGTVGKATGLAITPAIAEAGVDTNNWYLTHVLSGIAMAGPYKDPATAAKLAAILAQRDFDRSLEDIESDLMNRYAATVPAFNRALREVGQRGGSDPGLAGQLVADRAAGGIWRVVSDDGATLRVATVDGVGRDAPRSQIDTNLSEADFEGYGVAMPYDPAAHEQGKCAGCDRSSHGRDAGKVWYRMSAKSWCETCAPKNALDDGYEMPDAIRAASDAVEI